MSGEILGIHVLDSVVWTADGTFVSILDEAGLYGRLYPYPSPPRAPARGVSV